MLNETAARLAVVVAEPRETHLNPSETALYVFLGMFCSTYLATRSGLGVTA